MDHFDLKQSEADSAPRGTYSIGQHSIAAALVLVEMVLNRHLQLHSGYQ